MLVYYKWRRNAPPTSTLKQQTPMCFAGVGVRSNPNHSHPHIGKHYIENKLLCVLLGRDLRLLTNRQKTTYNRLPKTRQRIMRQRIMRHNKIYK